MTILRACFIVGIVGSLSLTANAELVGLWRFDAEANPQPDSSAFANDAEVIEATWVNDPDRGGVMNFEGEGNSNPVQWLEVEDSDSLSVEETGLTIAAWANFTQFDSFNSIVSKNGATNQNYPSPYDLYTTNNGGGIPRFYVGEDAANIAFSDAFEPAELDEWAHIAVTLDEEGEVVHYLNGEENGEGFIDRESVFLIDSDNPLFIGSRLDGATNMHGMLDDVAIFNHALTQDEINNIVSGDFSAYIGGGVVGDFNDNGERDPGDLDLLADGMMNNDAAFDLDDDGDADQEDRRVWIEDLTNTYYGDSDFSGEFNSSDFVKVFVPAKYETGEAATFEEGDWNGDKLFNSSDFVTAFSAGGYEEGPREGGLQVVPEPTCAVLLTVGLLCVFRRRR